MMSWPRPLQLCVTLLLLAIGPVLVALHPSIPFLNDGICDAWYVFGLFYHLPDALQWPLKDGVTMPYQAARLSNLLPGYLLTRAFNGIAADYAMFFIYYSASVFFFYRSVRILIDERVALFAAMFFAVHPLIIANYSVTFASAAILYSIISLFFVARAVDAKNRIGKIGFLFGSGIAMGAALYVHLGIVIYGVANYLIYLFYELLYSPETIRARIWHLAQAGCAVLAGVAGLTMVLGGVAILFGGSFSSVFEQFWFLSYEFSSEVRQEWSVPEWYLHGGTVGMFVAAMLLSAINNYLFSSRFGRATLPENVRKRASALSWAIFALTVVCLVYAALDGGMVQRDFYYVFFVPYLGAVIFSPLLFIKMGPRATIVWAIVFLICGLGASGLNEHVIGWLHRVPVEAFASVAAAICAGLSYGYLALSARRGLGPGALYAFSVLLMLIIVRPEETGLQIWNGPRDLHLAREYQRIREGLALLGTLHFKRRPQFWIDTESGPSELFAYPQSYFFCSFQKSFPAIDHDLWNWKDEYVAPLQFTPGQDVVVISRVPNLRAAAEAAFAALGLAVERVADFTLHFSRMEYEFLIEHVQGLDSRGEISLPIASFRPINGGSVSFRPDGLVLTTATPQWSYSLVEPLRYALENVHGPVGVRMRLRVEKGVIGIAVSARANVSNLIRRKDGIQTGEDQQEVCLYIPDPSAADLLIIQNESQSGASRAELHSVDLFRPSPQPQQPTSEPFNCEHHPS
jgi:hypothetical protein